MSASSTGRARVTLDLERTVAPISPLLFGGFAEHMGRCIYEGIYEPGSPLADERGFRRDTLDALRELNFRIVRYPGGNFLSGYHWRDGVGPQADRPRRRELAWRSIETNQFGTHEFMEFCRAVGTAPMLGVNLGTGTIAEAGALVEYCNAPGGTPNADLRIANGSPEPFNVRYWCLGNEMDGPWQIGHLDAAEYAHKAREAAKIMRWHDPSIKLILCGSSSTGMPTYPEWDRTVLEYCWDTVDYLSLHYYAGNRADDTPSYLALARQFEDHVDSLAATIRYVKALKRSQHNVKLSWDEWNIWYKNHVVDGNWSEAPHLIEEVYNLEDALVAAQWMNVFLRRCDVLEIACLAQIVNVIAPILTNATGLVKQTIYYPFMFYSRYASGLALEPLVYAPTYTTRAYGEQPLLDVSASHDPETGQSAVFLVNRSLTDTLETEITWRTGAPHVVEAQHILAGNDPKAANTFDAPNTVVPYTLAGTPISASSVTVSIPPLSVSVIVCR